MIALLVSGMLGAPAAATEKPPAAAHDADLIRRENAKPGAQDWQLTYVRLDSPTGYRSPGIEGYCSRQSVAAGESIDFMVSADPPGKFTIDIFRMGYYGGRGARQMTGWGRLTASRSRSRRSARGGCGNAAGRRPRGLTIPADWPSGVYLGRLSRVPDAEGRDPWQSYTIFIVRDDRPADILFQCSDNTWQAYNRWPDLFSLYDNGLTTDWTSLPDIDVSFDRPYGKYRQIYENPQSVGSGEFRRAAEEGAAADAASDAAWRREQVLLDRMQEIAEQTRYLPDAKVRQLVDWIRANMCPGLPPFGKKGSGAPAQWNDRRVLIFTENREGTKRYLKTILGEAIEGTERADERIEVIDGLTAGANRKEIQRRFNTDPAKDPLRILLATDAAREGLNFQAHCADLFHFDLPWNPGRIEQRNGRIDRKLQPADEVRCHYFVLPQRVEDRVLEVLVDKTETIRKELGSLSKVIDDDIERRLLKTGIRHRDVAQLADELTKADLDEERRRVTEEELEASRDRQEELKAQIQRCQTLLSNSRSWVGFEPEPFRDALSCSLEILGAPPLVESCDEHGGRVWTFPPLDRRAETDASWAATLDTLRTPRKTNQKLTEWRQEAPIRPVVFEDAGVLTDDTVHLHLEQRVAQRLLARFRSQGFIHHDLSRACLAQTGDSIPRVILLGRLSLYGHGAERLHEEIIPLAARWIEPSQRGDAPLKAYAREAETKTMELLERSLNGDGGRMPGDVDPDRAPGHDAARHQRAAAAARASRRGACCRGHPAPRRPRPLGRSALFARRSNGSVSAWRRNSRRTRRSSRSSHSASPTMSAGSSRPT